VREGPTVLFKLCAVMGLGPARSKGREKRKRRGHTGHTLASESADSDQLKPSAVRGTLKRVPGKDTEASIMGV
jgi:hypothetical protein